MEEGKVKRRVGWRPTGSKKAAEYSVPEVEGATWWRDGNEKRVGSAKGQQKAANSCQLHTGFAVFSNDC